MSSKYEFIDGEKANFPIISMCRWADVSRSGFYEWLERPSSATASRRFWLAVQVAKSFKRSNGTYGYRRIQADLAKNCDVHLGAELVRRLMADLGLVSCQPRPWRITTIPGGEPGPVDLVKRDFTAPTPGGMCLPGPPLSARFRVERCCAW